MGDQMGMMDDFGRLSLKDRPDGDKGACKGVSELIDTMAGILSYTRQMSMTLNR